MKGWIVKFLTPPKISRLTETLFMLGFGFQLLLLWHNMPTWLYIVAIIVSAVTFIAASISLLYGAHNHRLKSKLSN
jgi:hypothetical protein